METFPGAIGRRYACEADGGDAWEVRRVAVKLCRSGELASVLTLTAARIGNGSTAPVINPVLTLVQ